MSVLFLYEKPFVIQGSDSNKHTYLSETIRLTPEERADELALHKHIFKFILENKIGVIKEDTLYPSEETDGGSWIWFLNWGNFRALIDKHRHVELVNQLKANNQKGVNEVLGLHMRIGCMFEPILLNTVCNRVMNSVQLIPYEVPDTHEELSWEHIHKETPFVWLLILIQTILKNDSSKI